MVLWILILFLQFYRFISDETCVSGVCYYFNNISSSKFLSYDKALNKCKEDGQMLAIFSDKATQYAIENKTKQVYIFDEFYIGLRYQAKDFKWENGNYQIPNLKWTDNIDSNKDGCVFMKANGTMDIGDCSKPRNFICSNTSTSNTTNVSKGSCPKGFFRFADHCYWMNYKCSDDTYTWHEANDKCTSLTGSLVVIDSFQEQEFITALMTISPSPAWTGIVHKNISDTISLWVNNSTQTMIKYPIKFKKGEPNGYLTREEHCLMIYSRLSNIGYFNDELCNKSMNLICETPLMKEKQPITQNPLFRRGNCSKNYYQFNETCYLIQPLKKSYNDSDKYCNKKLLVVYNDIHIAFMRSLMAHVGVDKVWLDVRGENGKMNGATWILKETGETQETIDSHSCYYMTSNKGLNKTEYCNNTEISTSCYYYLPGHELITQESTCPLYWKKVGQKCFKVIQSYHSFSQAIAECKDLNSKLATLQSMKEVQAIDSDLTSDAWLGISGESYLNNTWIDGSSIDYCLFRHTADLTTLIKKNPKKLCFVIRAHKAEWNDVDCEHGQSNVCEMPTTKYKCNSDFPIYIDGDCFGSFSDELTWTDAEKSCQKKGFNNSHLASFYSMEQEHEVFSKINDTNEHWIGVKLYDFTQKWVDGSILNYQRNYMTMGRSNIFRCFSSQRSSMLDVLSIYWNKVNCEIKRKYICRISSSPKTPIIIDTSNLNKLFCPPGFIRFRNSCFKFINTNLTWTDADRFCRSKFKAGNNTARLASFDSREEFDFVLSHMRNTSSYYWIGLYRDDKTSQRIWINERPLTFLNFLEFYYSDTRSVLPGNYTAMFVSSHPFINGFWRLIADMTQLPFICRMDPYLEDGQVDHTQCPDSHSEYNGQCYSYNKLLLSFKDAYQACRSKNSDLLVLNDTFEEHFIRAFLSRNDIYSKQIWMGFRIDASPDMMMNWTTPKGAPIFYTHWNHLMQYEKNRLYSDESPQWDIHGCYLLNVTSQLDMYNEVDREIVKNAMVKTSCEMRIASVCKSSLTREDVDGGKKVTCAISSKNISYDLDVTKTKNGDSCIRWDIAKTTNMFQYNLQTFLYSSIPFNKDGYISYSLNRCSEMRNGLGLSTYSCYVFKGGRYLIEECQMQLCGTQLPKTKSTTNVRTVLVILITMTLLLFLISLAFFFRQRIFSNYRIRSLLAHSLGRYQPDCLGDPHRPHTSVSGGVGFSNPVYTALESRY